MDARQGGGRDFRHLMRILHVITGMQKAAGTSVFCGEVCSGLVRGGHDVTLAVPDPAAAGCYAVDPKVRIVAIESVLALRRNGASNVAPFDLVHIHGLWPLVLHKVSNWAHGNKIPVAWSPHGMLTPWAMKYKRWKKLPAWWLYQKRDLARAAVLHATADAELADFRRLGLANKVVIAPLGIVMPASKTK